MGSMNSMSSVASGRHFSVEDSEDTNSKSMSKRLDSLNDSLNGPEFNGREDKQSSYRHESVDSISTRARK